MDCKRVQPVVKEPKYNNYFSIEHCNMLFDDAQVVEVREGKSYIKRDLTKATSYIETFFYPLSNGFLCEREKNSYVFKKIEVVTKVYLPKLRPELKKWFLHDYNKIKRVITNVKLPRIGEDYVNMFNGFKHKKMPYSNYKNDIKTGVDIMNSYILEVLANNNQKVYDYIIKWYACIAQGKKNETCLYLKGPEGIGKSTISDFIRMHVIG
jgi:hypothetical protein